MHHYIMDYTINPYLIEYNNKSCLYSIIDYSTILSHYKCIVIIKLMTRLSRAQLNKFIKLRSPLTSYN